MIRNLFFLFFIFTCTSSSAQFFQANYGTPNNEDAFSVAVTTDNGFVLTGSSSGNGAGGKDAMLIKTNAGGLPLWSDVYGGSGDETALYVKALPDGGAVFCGETFSANPSGDAFIARTDANGNLVWWKNYGGADYDVAYSVCPLSDGGFIAAGLTVKSATDQDGFLIRMDANGDSIWTRTYGGPLLDQAVHVIPTSDNGFVFAGKISSYGGGQSDVWLLKTDANGNTLWTREIGGAGWDEGIDVIEIPTGFMVCGGTLSIGSGSWDFLLLQTDLSGNLIWSKAYGGALIEASYNVQQVPSGGYVFAGYTETFGPGHSRGTDSANVFVVRTDVLGDTLWSMAYGGLLKEECFSIVNTSDAGFAIAGYTGSFGDSLDGYIFKTDSNGYSGCNERRAHPDIVSTNLPEQSHSIAEGYYLSMSTFPVTTTMNVGTANAICGGPLSIGENQIQNSIEVFPNPATDQINFHWQEKNHGEKIQVSVYNNLGEQMRNENISFAETVSFSTKNLPDGIYFFRLHSGTAEKNLKVIVSH